MNDLDFNLDMFYDELDTVLLFCQQLSIIDQENKGIFESLASLSSEVVELSQCLLTEELSYGNAHRTVDEPSKMEAVDVMICALSIYFQRGGTVNDLIEHLRLKLNKWDTIQEKTYDPDAC